MQELGSDTYHHKCFGCLWLFHAEEEAFVQHIKVAIASLFAPQQMGK